MVFESQIITWDFARQIARIKADPKKDRFQKYWQNDHVQRLVQHTLLRWVYNPDEQCLFFHRPSEHSHYLYQVVLGSKEGDGVYKFSLRRRNLINTRKSGRTLWVYTVDNFEAVEIKSEKEWVGFTAFEMGKERFEQALIDQGILTMSELEEARRFIQSPQFLPQIRFGEFVNEQEQFYA